jgi:restriction system protein
MPRRGSRKRSGSEARIVSIALAVIILAALPGLVANSLTNAIFGPGHATLSALFVVVAYAATIILLIRLWRWNRRRRRLRAKTFGELLALTPSQFEAAVGDLLHDLGYHEVKRVGRSGDLAADLRCRDRQGRSVIVQCKRYAPGARVGSRDIQSFIGMVAVHHQADRGIFVTTSAFTQPAIDLAQRHDITLIDGEELVRLVEQVHAGNVRLASAGETHSLSS